MATWLSGAATDQGAAGFKWALMATAAESAEALANMKGLSEGLAPAEAKLVDEVMTKTNNAIAPLPPHDHN